MVGSSPPRRSIRVMTSSAFGGASLTGVSPGPSAEKRVDQPPAFFTLKRLESCRRISGLAEQPGKSVIETLHLASDVGAFGSGRYSSA